MQDEALTPRETDVLRLVADGMSNKEIASALNLSPGQVLAIEDTPAGISAAKGAGLGVIAVTNSYPASHLFQADRVVTRLDPAEILLIP